jgi:hypothetical protein
MQNRNYIPYYCDNLKQKQYLNLRHRASMDFASQATNRNSLNLSALTATAALKQINYDDSYQTSTRKIMTQIYREDTLLQ